MSKPYGRLRKFLWPSQKRCKTVLCNAESNLFCKKKQKPKIMIDKIVDWYFDLVFWANLSQKRTTMEHVKEVFRSLRPNCTLDV